VIRSQCPWSGILRRALEGVVVKKKTLITGSTGQVGSKTLDFLLPDKQIELVAAVRSPEKAAAFAVAALPLKRDVSKSVAAEHPEPDLHAAM
jgi:uncharacterized protein YbjT (DUF2867 family)